MARVKLVDKGTDYAIVKLIGLDGKNKRTVTWTVDGDSYEGPIDIESSALESPECYISGLQPNTTYRIGAYIVYNKGQSHMSLFLSPDLTTLPEEVDFGGDIDTKCTTDSISARLVGVNTDYPRNRVRLTLYGRKPSIIIHFYRSAFFRHNEMDDKNRFETRDEVFCFD